MKQTIELVEHFERRAKQQKVFGDGKTAGRIVKILNR